MHFCAEEARLLLACLSWAGPAAGVAAGWLLSSCGGHYTEDTQAASSYAATTPDAGIDEPSGGVAFAVDLR